MRNGLAATDGAVYVLSPSGGSGSSLTAIDAATGDKRFEATVNALAEGVAVAGGRVFVGGHYTVAAYDATTGQQCWAQETVGPVQSSPGVWNGSVFVGCNDQVLYALDTGTGEFKWTFRAERGIESTPAVADGTVYVESKYDKFYALNAETGAVEWARDNMGIHRTAPAVADGLIVCRSSDGYTALERATGDVRWHVDSERHHSPAIAHGVVFANWRTTEEPYWRAMALDATSGKQLWESAVGSNRPLVVAGDTLITGSDSIHAIDIATGEARWTMPLSPSSGSFAVLDDTLFVTRADNVVHAIA